jgi:hypothetical protein
MFLTAITSVYNQALLKTDDASLHASNALLYSFGVIINLTLYVVMSLLDENEPKFFQGFDSMELFLVIIGNVLVGLTCTVIFKCEQTWFIPLIAKSFEF